MYNRKGCVNMSDATPITSELLAQFEEKGEAILIKGAKVKMWGQVSGIQDFDGDKLAFIEVKDYEQDDGLDFLDGYDPKAY